MAFVEWSDDVTLGHEAMDEDHRHLAGLVSGLYEAFERNAEPAVVEEHLDLLGEHTKRHFKREESLMRDREYPNFVSHLYEHQALMTHLDVVRTIIARGKPEVVSGLVHYLRDWLVGHIRHFDKALADFLRMEAFPVDPDKIAAR